MPAFREHAARRIPASDALDHVSTAHSVIVARVIGEIRLIVPCLSECLHIHDCCSCFAGSVRPGHASIIRHGVKRFYALPRSAECCFMHVLYILAQIGPMQERPHSMPYVAGYLSMLTMYTANCCTCNHIPCVLVCMCTVAYATTLWAYVRIWLFTYTVVHAYCCTCNHVPCYVCTYTLAPARRTHRTLKRAKACDRAKANACSITYERSRYKPDMAHYRPSPIHTRAR